MGTRGLAPGGGEPSYLQCLSLRCEPIHSYPFLQSPKNRTALRFPWGNVAAGGNSSFITRKTSPTGHLVLQAYAENIKENKDADPRNSPMAQMRTVARP